jgi:hypothetical protein
MNNQPEQISSKPVSAPALPKATRGKHKGNPGVEYGKIAFRLPLHMERALRFASFQLEINPKATHKTPQAILEEGLRRHLDALSKHIEFLPNMLTLPKTPDTNA